MVSPVYPQVLHQEERRIQQIIDSLPQREVAIPGAVAMASALVSYLGPYQYSDRYRMLTVHWPGCLRERGIPLVVDSIDETRGNSLSHLIFWRELKTFLITYYILHCQSFV